MATYTKSAMQRLAETSKDFEIWWDSSPLIFKAWTKSMLEKAPQDKKSELEKQLKVLFDYDKPEDTLFCGVTTNPRLTRKVLELIPDDVNPVIDRLIKENPHKSSYELAWLTYKAITEMGTQLYMPLFEKSKYEKG